MMTESLAQGLIISVIHGEEEEEEETHEGEMEEVSAEGLEVRYGSMISLKK